MYIENVLLREIGKAYDVRILEVIGNGKKRYSDIQSVVARNDNGSLSKQMNNLMDMETITKVFPINRPDDKKKVFLWVQFYQNPMTEQECRNEQKQMEAIPCIKPAAPGFVCSAGFDFMTDRYRLISGEDLLTWLYQTLAKRWKALRVFYVD